MRNTICRSAFNTRRICVVVQLLKRSLGLVEDMNYSSGLRDVWEGFVRGFVAFLFMGSYLFRSGAVRLDFDFV